MERIGSDSDAGEQADDECGGSHPMKCQRTDIRARRGVARKRSGASFVQDVLARRAA